MDNDMELRGQDLTEGFKPEPRDIIQVLSSFAQENGNPEVAEEPTAWHYQFADGRDFKARIEDEYTDVILDEANGLEVADNSFTGVIFRKGDVMALEALFERVKPILEAQGHQF